MRKLQLTNKVSISIIKDKMANSKSSGDYKRWQILYLVSSYDVDAAYLSDITGYSKANVYAIIQQHNNPLKSDVTIKKRGGRTHSFLSVEQEQILMNGLEDKALKGQILSCIDIKTLVEKEVGKKVSDDFIWDLFKRNKWTKHSPRPHHPKKDTAKQEEFKKNSKAIWLPSKMIL